MQRSLIALSKFAFKEPIRVSRESVRKILAPCNLNGPPSHAIKERISAEGSVGANLWLGLMVRLSDATGRIAGNVDVYLRNETTGPTIVGIERQFE